MRAYLDDSRTLDGFDVCLRSTHEAISFVEKNGCPSFISFDFDLGGNDRAIDFVKWLVEKDIDSAGTIIPKNFSFDVHSANPVGSAELMAYLNGYLTFRQQMLDIDI
ncbi:MAG: hypothetical protein D6732_27515 [Methanobacteriota archaeon]|nr:MAG: hypothetical protein D6732_27515 [Euryarchaeota archaeon]